MIRTAAIRIAVIGAGHWGPNLIRSFADHPASEVAWVVDTNPERLQRISDRHPQAAIGPDASVALADPRVDAVVVATPTSTHYYPP